MEPPKLKRRNTIVEEAADSLIETGQKIEELNKKSVMNFNSVNPGLGFRPQKDPESELIALNTSSWKPTYHYLDIFLQSYESGRNTSFIGAHGRSVTFDYAKVIDGTPCAKAKQFGMSSGTPCVVVKLNKIYGWFPRYSSANLPTALSKIDSDEKFVFIACKGEYPADEDNMGHVDYYSSYPNTEIGGVNFKYFPYRNQPNYLSPLVFVHFKNATKNVLINVECRAYAKNIENADLSNTVPKGIESDESEVEEEFVPKRQELSQ
ncbi:sodium potassium-transporting ATPase subunit beta-like [Brachionus plicatilis]|uniref:Sodium potassium-transporting ATPase subunit beta-like n=1 Tax=Brachionus plicatilis TaxID=10195 RepID=A0A3M7S3Y6_BRAPC|nr:sodium potassium-transporting ATPase subunit beta-like [Brachionus plicatilis]